MRPLTLRSAMGLVASFALMLTLVRAIEQDEHGRQQAYWKMQAKGFLWAADQVAGDPVWAARHRRSADELLDRSRESARRMNGIPRSLTRPSIIVILLEICVVTLFLGKRADGSSSPIETRRFRIWMAGNAIAPGVVVALAIASALQVAVIAPRLAVVLEGTIWIQFVYALAGIARLRGFRVPAAFIGTVSTLLVGFLSVIVAVKYLRI